MPGLLIDAIPFSAPRDADLETLVSTLDAALAPDAVELVLRCPESGRRFRRRVAGGRDSGLRPYSPGRGGETPVGEVLVVSFGEPSEWEGRLLLLRRRVRPWTGAETTRFSLLAPLASQLLTRLSQATAHRCARERLLALAEATEEPAILFDRAGTILFANEAADALMSQQTEHGLAVLSGDRRSTPLVSRLMQLASLGTSTIDDVRPGLLARGVSDREAEVVSGVLRGLRNSEIAAELFISEYTVKDHLKHAFRKLSVASRGELLRTLHAVPGPSLGRAS